MRKIEASGPGVNRMTPSRFHVPPLVGPTVINVCADPPSTSSRFNLPSAKNPMDRLSGDQKGDDPFSVPFNGRAVVESSGRSQILEVPEVATKTILRPSGEI